MRFAASSLAAPSLATLALVLSSCSRTTDNFAPRIFITSPSETGVSQSRTPLVQGYVMDDTGVTRIMVDDKATPILPGSDKIARFKFQAQVKGESSKYTLKAYDAAGHESVLTVPVTVDNTKPQISVKTFERRGRSIRVTGIVTDDIQVAEVIVDGNRLNITPGKRVEFYAETTGIYADIEAYDAAGNKVNVRAQR